MVTQVNEDLACPVCGASPMELRDGRNGKFWGCPNFAGGARGCRGTRQLNGADGLVSPAAAARRSSGMTGKPPRRNPDEAERVEVRARRKAEEARDPVPETAEARDSRRLALVVLAVRQIREDIAFLRNLIRDVHVTLAAIAEYNGISRGAVAAAREEAARTEEVRGDSGEVGELPPYGAPPPVDEVPF